MKILLLLVVAISGGAFATTPADSQPSQQPAVIPPELLQLSLEPQLIASIPQPPTQLTPVLTVRRQENVFIDRRAVAIDPLPPADYSVELLPLARLRGDLIDDRH